MDLLLLRTVTLISMTVLPTMGAASTSPVVVWLVERSGNTEDSVDAAVAAAVESELTDLEVDLVRSDTLVQNGDDAALYQERADRIMATKQPLAVVWYDAQKQRAHVVYRTPEGDMDGLTRSIPDANKTGAMAETVANMVREWTRALLSVTRNDADGDTAASDGETEPAPSNAGGNEPEAAKTKTTNAGNDTPSTASAKNELTDSVASAEAHRRIRFETAYRMSLFSNDTVPQHGAAVGIGVRLMDWLHVTGGYLFFPPQGFKKTVDADEALYEELVLRTTLIRHCLTVMFKTEMGLGRWGLGGGVGVEGTTVNVSTKTDAERLDPKEDVGGWQTSIPVELRLFVSLPKAYRLFVGATLDIALDRVILSVTEGEDNRIAYLAPYRLQGMISVGISASYF